MTNVTNGDTQKLLWTIFNKVMITRIYLDKIALLIQNKKRSDDKHWVQTILKYNGDHFRSRERERNNDYFQHFIRI